MTAHGLAPLLSAIVRAPPQAELLRNALESLSRQTLPRGSFEVILVDPASSEEVRELARSFDAHVSLEYAPQRSPGRGAGWNTGILASRGELLLFLEGSAAADPGLLEAHVAAHRRLPAREVGVVGHTRLAPELESDPLMHFAARPGRLFSAFSHLEAGAALDFTHFRAGRSSCKRSMLLEHGMFDPAFRDACEDVELAFRLSRHGFRVVYEPSAVTTRVRRESVDDLCECLEREGRESLALSLRHPEEEVQRFTEAPQAREAWRRLGPGYELLRRSARELDRIARLRLAAGLGLAPADAALLYQGYWNAFQASRCKGIAESAAGPGDR